MDGKAQAEAAVQQLSQLLKEHKKVLADFWELPFSKQNRKVLSEFLRIRDLARSKLDIVPDENDWGVCCLDGVCWNEYESVCRQIGGSFSLG